MLDSLLWEDPEQFGLVGYSPRGQFIRAQVAGSALVDSVQWKVLQWGSMTGAGDASKATSVPKKKTK